MEIPHSNQSFRANILPVNLPHTPQASPPSHSSRPLAWRQKGAVFVLILVSFFCIIPHSYLITIETPPSNQASRANILAVNLAGIHFKVPPSLLLSSAPELRGKIWLHIWFLLLLLLFFPFLSFFLILFISGENNVKDIQWNVDEN